MWKRSVSFNEKASGEPISGGSWNISYTSDLSSLRNFSKILRGTACAQAINFQDPAHKNDIEIFDQIRISNFSKKPSKEPIYMASNLEY